MWDTASEARSCASGPSRARARRLTSSVPRKPVSSGVALVLPTAVRSTAAAGRCVAGLSQMVSTSRIARSPNVSRGPSRTRAITRPGCTDEPTTWAKRSDLDPK